ncbi:MAG: DUF2807 domain-containing protein [Candidatus Cloacimonetes bacterium]|nr:DUF2807 domain-containing protein [Candidatus Cloacimonadota bacterium]
MNSVAKRGIVLVFTILCLLITFGCLNSLSGGNMEFVHEMRLPTQEFSSLHVSGNFDVFFTQAAERSVVLKASEETHLQSVKFEYRDQILEIYKESEENNSNNNRVINVNSRNVTIYVKDGSVLVDAKTKLQLYISAPSIERIEQAGSGKIVFDPFVDLPKLNFDIAGSGNIYLPDIKVDQLSFDIAGSGTVNVSGHADILKIDSAGAGNINAKDLIAQKVNIDAAGAVSANVYAAEELKIDLAGAGRVNYWGNPRVNRSVAGIGRITNMD